MVDGGRRLRALKHLLNIGHLAADFEVPAQICELDDAAAMELSLATVITKLDLNPADEAMNFAGLVKTGRSVDNLAASFGVTVRRVKQRLAIAALPPEIVAALRAGCLSLETAQAFTVSSDTKLVSKLFKEHGDRHASWIRTQLMTKRHSFDSLEGRYVGTDAYAAAGGHIDEDLFANNQWAGDTKLLLKLFEAKLKAEEARLLAEGWSFVIVETERYGGKTSAWATLKPDTEPKLDKDQKARVRNLDAEIRLLRRRIDKADDDGEDVEALNDELDRFDRERNTLTAASFSPAQMKKSGAILQYTHNGINLRLGVLKPSATKKAKPSPKPSSSGASGGPTRSIEPDAEADFTGALQLEMAKAMTHAMQRAIAAKPGLGSRIAAAALMALALDHTAPPFAATVPHRSQDIDNDVQHQLNLAAAAFRDDDGLKDLGEILRILTTVDADVVAAITAQSTAALLNLGATIADEDRTLIDTFDPDVGAVWQPSEEFFKRCPRDSLAAAFNEAAIPGVAPSKKKKDLVEMALRDLVPLGWLPKPLRTPCYKGPGSNHWADAKSAQLADEIASSPDRHSGESRNPASQAAE